jgi:hypothetical protein
MIEEANTHVSKKSFFQTTSEAVRRRLEPLKPRYARMILTLDHLLGLRAFGLVVYGALPASLGALGAFKPPDQTTLGGKIGLAALPYIFIVALIPVVLTYFLVRQRLANWYLLRDYLSIRATAITVAIIAISCFVCAANGLLVGTFKRVPINRWWALPFHDKAWPIGVCLLLSFAYLVGSSTLFLTVVKEDGNLPLLPNKTEVDNVASLRGKLRDIAHSEIQVTKFEQAQLRQLGTTLTELIAAASNVIIDLQKGFVGIGRERFYADLSAQLSDLNSAATDAAQSALTWEYYWDPKFDPGTLNDEQKGRRNSIKRLKELKIDG